MEFIKDVFAFIGVLCTCVFIIGLITVTVCCLSDTVKATSVNVPDSEYQRTIIARKEKDMEYIKTKDVLMLIADEESLSEKERLYLIKTVEEYVHDNECDCPMIVKCKDCYHHVIRDGFNGIPSYMFCGKTERIVKPDWYCADGERRTDE